VAVLPGAEPNGFGSEPEGTSSLLLTPGVSLDSPTVLPFFIPDKNVPDFRSSFLIRDSPALPIPIPPNDLLSNLLGALTIFLTPPTIDFPIDLEGPRVAFPSDLLTRPTLPTDLLAMPTLPIDFSSPTVPPTLPSVLDFIFDRPSFFTPPAIVSDDRPTLGGPSLSALKPWPATCFDCKPEPTFGAVVLEISFPFIGGTFVLWIVFEVVSDFDFPTLFKPYGALFSSNSSPGDFFLANGLDTSDPS